MPRKIDWTVQARADIRRLDRQIAMRLLTALARFRATGSGDLKRLEGTNPPRFRLRVGDYRIRFQDLGDTLQILRVLHRREAYR